MKSLSAASATIWLIGGGGKDAFHGGAGNDTIVLAPGEVTRVDGGSGVDRVMVNDFGPELDFTGGLRDQFQSVEIWISISSSSNQVTLNSASVSHMTGRNGSRFAPSTLVIRGDEARHIIFSDQGWINGDEVTDPFGQSGTYDSWTNGSGHLNRRPRRGWRDRVDLADFSPEEGFTIGAPRALVRRVTSMPTGSTTSSSTQTRAT